MAGKNVDEGGWLLLPRDSVPARWMGRATDLSLVPLLPEEAAALLADQAVEPQVGPEDERLLSLVASGMRLASIARELGVSVRTIEYRLQRLRHRWNLESTAELVAFLADRGFGQLRKSEHRLRRRGD